MKTMLHVLCKSKEDIYIKGDRTKHISPKFFYTHELQKDSEIDVQQIRSNDNLVDLFTKVMPSATFKKLVRQVGIRQLKDLQIEKLKTI